MPVIREKNVRQTRAHQPLTTKRPRSARQHSERPRSARQHSERPRSVKKLASGVAVFVMLGIYFFWMANEMGAHAISGKTEMAAIFGAILVGVVAALAGGAFMRRHD